VDARVVADDVKVGVGVAVARDGPVTGRVEIERIPDAIGDVSHGLRRDGPAYSSTPEGIRLSPRRRFPSAS
jgi:hypothetical protein